MNICSRIPPVTVVLQLTLACATALAVNEAELPKLFNVEVGGYNKDWNEYGNGAYMRKGAISSSCARTAPAGRIASGIRRALSKDWRTTINEFAREGSAIKVHVDATAQGDRKELAAIADWYVGADFGQPTARSSDEDGDKRVKMDPERHQVCRRRVHVLY